MREIEFYRTDMGKCPIEEFLDSLSGKQAQKIAWVLQLIEELYPKELKMRVGGKRTKPLSIEVLCDWAERAQPTTTQLQRRRV